MWNPRKMCVLCLMVLVGVCSASDCFAQSATATVSGRVTDPSDAAVPGARVDITNTATNITATTRTNNEGLYVFPNLNPGRYRLTVSGQGFKTVTKVDIVLHIQDSVAHNFSLPLGSVTESITITARSEAIETSGGWEP